jgi:hypothetical protein
MPAGGARTVFMPILFVDLKPPDYYSKRLCKCLTQRLGDVRDQALLATLRGAERKVVDIPIQRHDNPIRRKLLTKPDNTWGG